MTISSRAPLLTQRAPLGTILTEIAKSRAEIDQARLLVLTAAHQIDVARPKGAMKDIGVAKVRNLSFHRTPDVSSTC